MKDIKYRVWIIDKQRMDMVDCLEFRENVGIKYIHTRFYGLRLKPSEVVLMQCTDSKDKNGKDIYEGDVLRMNISGSSYNLLVAFKDNSFKLYDIDFRFHDIDEYLKNIQHTPESQADCLAELYTLDPKDAALSEIIGNICENEELLKDK